MALDTVSDYITEARVLLQDEDDGNYRYQDSELLTALNIAIMEARKIRADLFVPTRNPLPSFSVNDDTSVPIDPQYRSALLWFICGHAQLRDDEITQDARATVFMNRFYAGLASLGMGGGGGPA